jgi:hypothetical protein
MVSSCLLDETACGMSCVRVRLICERTLGIYSILGKDESEKIP